MNDNDKPTGMSAFERDVRDRLKDAETFGKVEDNEVLLIEIGVLRGLIRDIEMWHEIVKNDIDKWSFDALIAMAKRILDEVYPDTVFTGEKAGPGNEGVTFVVNLRKVIEQMEAQG